MRRPDEVPSTQPRGKWPDEGWAKKYPLLCEHIGDDSWEDGTPREASTLGVKGEDGRVVVSLNDREAKRSLYRSGESVQEALLALEKALGGTGADWRSWNGGRGKGRK